MDYRNACFLEKEIIPPASYSGSLKFDGIAGKGETTGLPSCLGMQ